MQQFTDHVTEAVVAACEPMHPLAHLNPNGSIRLYLYDSLPRAEAKAVVELCAGEHKTATVAVTARLMVARVVFAPPVAPNEPKPEGKVQWITRGKLTVTPLDLGALGNVRQWIAALKGDKDALALLDEVRAEAEVPS